MLPDQITEWIESAERDRDTVAILSAAARVPYEIVAYHCQQCAEKYLKTLFVRNRHRTPFIHDLLKLNRQVQSVCTVLEQCEVECERLTPFGTATRYPGGLMQVRPEHIPQVTEWMEKIRSAVRSCLDLSSP